MPTLIEKGIEMEKVYCKDCKYCEFMGTVRLPSNRCLCPVDNYFAPDAPCRKDISIKNEKNNCRDFKKKND